MITFVLRAASTSESTTGGTAVLCKFSTKSFFNFSRSFHIFLLIYKLNEISFVPPVEYLDRINLFLTTKKTASKT